MPHKPIRKMLFGIPTENYYETFCMPNNLPVSTLKDHSVIRKNIFYFRQGLF